MSRILVVFGTREGHTAHLAGRIATGLRDAGHDVAVRNVRTLDETRPLDGYDAVIVGASVHAGRYERELCHWVRTHGDQLRNRPNAFFSVSLASSGHDARHDAEVAETLDRFLRGTHWQPRHIETFAGALPYSKYNWFMKRLMRRIVRKEEDGKYTDMSHDWDLTDYEQVDDFTQRFGAELLTSP
ncbi:MAG TPA: flavodoxin domain-containing protein [Acidimicrobiia bacterium]|nr:flavodoxin domain-containing protein [Acidimicrobiia bacterium]